MRLKIPVVMKRKIRIYENINGAPKNLPCEGPSLRIGGAGHSQPKYGQCNAVYSNSSRVGLCASPSH